MYVHRGSKGGSPRYDIFGPTDSRESYEEIYPIISYGQTRVTIQTDHSCSVGHRSRDSRSQLVILTSDTYFPMNVRLTKLGCHRGLFY